MVNASSPVTTPARSHNRSDRANAARHYVQVQTSRNITQNDPNEVSSMYVRRSASSVASLPNIMNHESRMRLMVERLNNLSVRIGELRAASTNLTTPPTPSSARALAQSVSGFDTSLEMLDCAIEDLEITVNTTARQFERTTPLSAWHGIRSANAMQADFSPSPARSLLSRARRAQPTPYSENLAHHSQLLESRLGTFSANLEALNLRLDRVARTFRDMHGRVPNGPEYHRSALNEFSPEEIEFHRRLDALPESIASQGLLPVSRRVLQMDAQILPPEDLPDVQLMPSCAETASLTESIETESCTATFCDMDTGYSKISAPSSHEPLFCDIERKFIDGIEYRNCLGLWLSQSGQLAPD